MKQLPVQQYYDPVKLPWFNLWTGYPLVSLIRRNLFPYMLTPKMRENVTGVYDAVRRGWASFANTFDLNTLAEWSFVGPDDIWTYRNQSAKCWPFMSKLRDVGQFARKSKPCELLHCPHCLMKDYYHPMLQQFVNIWAHWRKHTQVNRYKRFYWRCFASRHYGMCRFEDVFYHSSDHFRKAGLYMPDQANRILDEKFNDVLKDVGQFFALRFCRLLRHSMAS